MTSSFSALAATVLGCRRCSVLLPDPDGYLVVDDSVGLPAGVVARIRIPPGQGIAGQVAQSGEPMIVNDFAEPPTASSPIGIYTTQSYLSFPIPLPNGKTGVISLTERQNAEPFGSNDLDVLRGLVGYYTAVTAGSSAVRVSDLRYLRRREIQIQEEERQRLARDLHDDAGHRILAAVLRLDVAAQQCEASSRIRQELEALRQMLGECADGLHEVAFSLRPQILSDLGLVPAIRALARRVQETTRTQVYVLDDGIDRRPAESHELAAFRIAQEALTNALKYADASTIKITITESDGQINLSVSDNGNGFDPANVDSSTRAGIGLRGMCERAALVGGSVDILSGPGRGTTIRARIPISEEA